jgi:hypothetical protein
MRRWWWLSGGVNGVPQEGPYGPDNYGYSFIWASDVTHPFNRDPYKDLGDTCSSPSVGPYRLDTVQPGLNGLDTRPDYNQGGINETGVAFTRQSDNIPQPLTVMVNHPILALSGGRYLSYLPDHMHEGLVIGGGLSEYYGLGSTQQTFDHGGTTINEYPTIAGEQPLPQIIAQVQSLSHTTPATTLTSGQGQQQVDLPRLDQHLGALDPGFQALYPAISVYDGTSVKVGRVVTQSSFHHFLDINLLGDPPAVHAGDSWATGLTQIVDLQSYWWNLTVWLAPQALKPAIMLAALDQARRNLSIRTVHRPEMKQSGHAVHGIGQMVAQHLDARLTAPMLQDVVESSLEPEHRAAINGVLANRRRSVPHIVSPIQRTFLHGFLGGAILHALEYPLTRSFHDEVDVLRPKFVSAGLHGAGRSLASSQHREVIPDLVELLHRFGGPEAISPTSG